MTGKVTVQPQRSRPGAVAPAETDGPPRPPRLPFSATHVVKASLQLTPAEKLLWLEHLALDNSDDGCFIGAGHLADRLGLERGTVEAYRRRFVDAGLLVRKSRGPGRTDRWYPTLPPTCCPRPRRLTADQVALLAERLDLHLTRLKVPQSGAPGYATRAPTVAESE